MATKHLIVVGGGLIGLATAYKLGFLFPDHCICVLEKEASVGQHQSGHNSGVLHCGLHYRPGSFKARLAVKGISEMVAFCQKHDVKYEICGKIVVAVNASQMQQLRALEKRGKANGLEGLCILDEASIREIEPHVKGIAALKVPQEGIVDFSKVARALASEIEAAGNKVLCNQRVIMFRKIDHQWLVRSLSDEYRADYLVVCAGLHSDRLSELGGEGEGRQLRIVPFRGEYFSLNPSKHHLVKHLIYPVPDPDFPFLGAHLTRRIGGGIEAGPNAVLAFSREGYRRGDFCFADFIDALSFSGLWRFVAKHPKMTFYELARSFSKRRFCESLQGFLPALSPDDLTPSRTGVRAQAMRAEGTLCEDFEMIEREAVLHVLNAPSPAATASLAIGGEIAKRVERYFSNLS